MRNKSLIKSILISLLAVILVITPIAVTADSVTNVPYANYTYWEGDSAKVAVPTKAVYEPSSTITGEELGIGSFSELQHLFTYNDNIYILDSANGRIVVIDKNNSVLFQVNNLTYNNEELSFVGAKGIYVDESGIYIADTANKRVICLDSQNNVKKIVTRPNDTTIPETFDFAPLKLIKDSCGYYYLLCEGSYYGMMVFTENFDFCGFFGANNVSTSFSTAIKEYILSLFETEEKHTNSVQALPFSLLDICLDKDGFIVTVNGETKGQIRRFGLSGKNTLKKNSNFKTYGTDSYNFADSPVMYVDKTSKYNTFYQCSFCAITASKDGFYYAIEGTQGRIYMYDKNCNLITVFGGGIRQGSQLGTFISPTSVTSANDKLYVSDFSTGKITVYKKTEYGKTLIKADGYFVSNEYVKGKQYFEEVNKQDKNCQIAYKGLAKAYLKQGENKKAMEYAKLGLDKKIYSEAFSSVRNKFISDNFWWLFALALAAVILLCIFLFGNRKKTNFKNPKINTLLKVPLHPMEAFNDIKYKGMGSVIIATVLLALFYVTDVATRLYGGFAFSNVNLTSFNAILTLVGTVGIVLIWTVSNWLVCILFEGKGKIKDIYCGSCYALIPMIFYNVCFVVLSNVLVPTTNSMFDLFKNICYLITALFLLLSVMVIHDFTFFKSLAISIVVVVGMAIVAFVIFIMLTLWQDLVNFVMQIVNEATMR